MVGSIFTMTGPELNTGNTEVNKIVLGIGKSRQNNHRVCRICMWVVMMGREEPRFQPPFFPSIQEMESRKIHFKMRKTGAHLNAGEKEGDYREGRLQIWERRGRLRGSPRM